MESHAHLLQQALADIEPAPPCCTKSVAQAALLDMSRLEIDAEIKAASDASDNDNEDVIRPLPTCY